MMWILWIRIRNTDKSKSFPFPVIYLPNTIYIPLPLSLLVPSFPLLAPFLFAFPLIFSSKVIHGNYPELDEFRPFFYPL